MYILLTATRTMTSLLFLFYASWSDHKTREVSNTVWIVSAPVAFTLTFFDIYMSEPSTLFSFGISFGLTAAFSIILFYAGGFGGADAKALMCLALALPFFPTNLITPISGGDSVILKTLFPITVFSNAVLFAAATAIYMLFRNVYWHLKTGNHLFEGGQEKESLGKKILVLLTGYKMPIDKVKKKWHLYPLEDIVEESEQKPRRKLIIIPSDENRNAVIERLEKAIRSGSIEDRILATPGLPMLIFVTAGLVTALIFGDIVWICVRLILG